VLTRLTAWVEMGASNDEVDPTDRFLMRRPGDRDFEIEHLFTSTASEYAHKVVDARYYGYLRNRIGALLLVDGPENGSYGGTLLEDKLTPYRKDTRLAGMLNPDFFERGVTITGYCRGPNCGFRTPRSPTAGYVDAPVKVL
jgi:hypothetical protein